MASRTVETDTSLPSGVSQSTTKVRVALEIHQLPWLLAELIAAARVGTVLKKQVHHRLKPPTCSQMQRRLTGRIAHVDGCPRPHKLTRDDRCAMR